ncbi:MAG: ABC transporter ATP-binding protein [Archaeoglobaceae archaeon]
MIETKNLRKEFGGVVAIKNLNINIGKEGITVIIGPNGSGKSTLINLLCGTLTPTAGKIYFEGKDITSLPSYMRARLGLIKMDQYVQIFSDLTVYENLVIAMQKKTKLSLLKNYEKSVETEKIREILEVIGLHTKYRSQASTCSYGEQRRLQIGMILAANPKLILMDEPTSGISPREKEKIIALLQNLSKEKKLVIVEHDMNVVQRLADTVIVLNEGEVVATGEPEKVLNSPEVKEIYMR